MDQTGYFHGKSVRGYKAYQRAHWSMQMTMHCYSQRLVKSNILLLFFNAHHIVEVENTDSCCFEGLFINILSCFRSSWQSLRGSLLALFYASTVLSGFTTVGLLLLAKQLSSEKEWIPDDLRTSISDSGYKTFIRVIIPPGMDSNTLMYSAKY